MPTQNAPYQNYLIHVDVDFFITLYENNWPVTFYVYHRHCTFVNKLEPILYTYLQQTNLLLFAFDYASTNWEKFSKQYAPLLAFQGTPTFYFWQKDDYYEKITGIKHLETLELMHKTFAEQLTFYNINVTHDKIMHNENENNITSIINTKESKVIKFFTTQVLPLLSEETPFYVTFTDEESSAFYFGAVDERIKYTRENEKEIIKQIKNYI